MRVSTHEFVTDEGHVAWVRAVRRAGLRIAASRFAIREFFLPGKPTVKIQADRQVSPIKGSLNLNFGFFLPGIFTTNSHRRCRSQLRSAVVLPPAHAIAPHTQANLCFNFLRSRHCARNCKKRAELATTRTPGVTTKHHGGRSFVNGNKIAPSAGCGIKKLTCKSFRCAMRTPHPQHLHRQAFEAF